jgi:hypothetical protein
MAAMTRSNRCRAHLISLCTRLRHVAHIRLPALVPRAKSTRTRLAATHSRAAAPSRAEGAAVRHHRSAAPASSDDLALLLPALEHAQALAPQQACCSAVLSQPSDESIMSCSAPEDAPACSAGSRPSMAHRDAAWQVYPPPRLLLSCLLLSPSTGGAPATRIPSRSVRVPLRDPRARRVLGARHPPVLSGDHQGDRTADPRPKRQPRERPGKFQPPTALHRATLAVNPVAELVSEAGLSGYCGSTTAASSSL